MKMCKKLISMVLVMALFVMNASFEGFAFEESVDNSTSFTKMAEGGRQYSENSLSQNTLNIAMASDNNYVYPLIVAMTSIMENKNANTKIDFYIMISGDFLDENKTKIMSLQSKYNNCHITLIDMKDKLENVYTSRHITEAAYYRLMLPFVLPNLDKVLYLDPDIIVCKDLSDLYSYDLDNYYLAGVLDVCVGGANMVNVRAKRTVTEKDFFTERFGVENYKKQYVATGMLLFNLSKIRADKRHFEFIENAKKYEHMYHDQDVLNFVCFGHILILPEVYHQDARFAMPNEQVVIHYASKFKPWNTPTRRLANLWRDYAKKTSFYKEIESWSSSLIATNMKRNKKIISGRYRRGMAE